MVRKRKSGPRKATVPLSQIAAQLQEEKAAVEATARPSTRATGVSAGAKPAAPTAVPDDAEGIEEALAEIAGELDEADASDAAASSDAAAAADAAAAGPASVDPAPDRPEASKGSEDTAAAEDPESAAAKNAKSSGAGPEAAGEDAESVAEGEGAESDSSAKSGKPAKRKSVRNRAKPKHLWLWIAAGIVALVVIAASFFAWDRWLRYDDAADFQGQWHIADSAGIVTIDEGSIHLTDKEAYAYTMDPGAKTLAFTFGDLSGQARYRFSADRTQVAIQDGEFGTLDTILSDISWSWSCLISMITGQPQTSPSLGEGSLVLTREAPLPQEQPADGAEGAEEQPETEGDAADGQPAGDAASGDQEAAGDEGAGTDADQTDDAADQAEAEAAAAAEEQRQNELRIQDALDASGESGAAGSNAVSPEDLM